MWVPSQGTGTWHCTSGTLTFVSEVLVAKSTKNKYVHTHTYIRGRARAREHMQACGPRQGGCCPGKTFRPTPGGMLPWQHFFFAWLRVGFLTTSGCLSVRGRAPQAPCRHQALFKLASLSCGRRFLRGLLLDIRWDSLSHGARSYTATRLENYRAGGPRGYQ